MLENLLLDIDELIDNLSDEWTKNSDSKFNTNAFQNKHLVGENYMCCCPFHAESRPSFGILNSYPYVWNCFVCGGGSLYSLVAHVLRIPIEEAEQYLLSNYYVADIKERPKIDIASILDGTEGKGRASHPDDVLSTLSEQIHPYLYSRGFTNKTINKYEIRYDKETNSIAFPVRASDGSLRFIKKRLIHTKQFLNEEGKYKRDIVYGLYYLLKANEVVPEIYLNESETDTMACYQKRLPAGAVLGRFLFKEQVTELLKAGVKTVNLFYDNDLHGLRAAYQSYQLLRKTPVKVNMIMYPGYSFGIDTFDIENIAYKDANDLLIAGKLTEIRKVPFEICNVNWKKIIE